MGLEQDVSTCKCVCVPTYCTTSLVPSPTLPAFQRATLESWECGSGNKATVLLYQCLQFSSRVSAHVGKYYSKLWLSAHGHLLGRLWLVRNIVSCEVKLQNMMTCT